MPVTYRNMLPEDEDALFELRMRTWGHPSIEHVRRNAYSDPHYLRHTHVGMAPDGTLLSTVSYRPRDVRDAAGTPRSVGCVASVITIEAARHQGHARKLMQLAIECMRDEGCVWSLLFSSRMGVQLYEGLGYRLYPAPYYRGTLGKSQQPVTGLTGAIGVTGGYSIARLEAPFELADRQWQAVRHIYAAYNAHRPMSLVRDEEYWRGYVAPRVSEADIEDMKHVFLASAGGQPVAYLLTRLLSGEPAHEYFNEDQGLVISEAGLLPGHDGVLPALLTAAQHELLPQQSQRQLPSASYLPGEAAVDQAMAMFGQTLHISSERRMMALPLGDHFSESDLAAAFAAPGALFWPIDSF